MSGTRLLSPGEPATDGRPAGLGAASSLPALLIVAHGERGGAGADHLVHALVDRVRPTGRFRSVQACFVSKAPRLTDTLVGLSTGPVVVYPLFMSDGYFVRHAIPEAISAASTDGCAGYRRVELMPPFGLSPGLPGLIARLARETASCCGLSSAHSHVLLVAHGSKHDSASRLATLRLADLLDKAGLFAGVDQCFLEEVPFVDERIATVQGPAIVVGLFAGEGMHGAVDLPGAIEKSRRTDIVLATPLTRVPDLPDLVQGDLNRFLDKIEDMFLVDV